MLNARTISAVFLTTWSVFTVNASSELKDSFQKASDDLSKMEMQSIVQFLGDDLLEGRAPGTQGAELAEEYLQSIYKSSGFQPNPENGSFFQPFELQGFTTKEMQLTAGSISFQFKDEVVGVFPKKLDTVSLDAEAIFVGFGISTEIMDWDDYKDADVRGKIVVARVNDPGLYRPEIFEGKTLTYFGRWTYHIEEAIRHGAAGILLIHTDEHAGYDWNVVRNSWSGESLYIESDLQNDMVFSGWIKESSFKRMLETNGLKLEALYKNTTEPSFSPIPLVFNIKISGKNAHRTVQTRNVIAHIPGKSKKRIVLSAHLDHLGLADAPDETGDNIYNGAIDNGSAVAAMVLTAKILKQHQEILPYSITILACNAEESGLLGSKFYAQNTDRDSILANINFESTPVWKASKSVMGIGARFSEIEPMLKKLTAEQGINYSRFSRGNQGLFYRSDQFSFARYGVPAVWISAGEDEVNGDTTYTEFWSKNYHTVRDEYSDKWEFEGMRQTIRYALLLIDAINQSGQRPGWVKNLPFVVEEH